MTGTTTRGRAAVDEAVVAEQITDRVLAADAHLFDVKPIALVKERVRRNESPKGYVAKNPERGLRVDFLTTAKAAADVEVRCTSPDGKLVGVYKGSGKPGLDGFTFEVKEPGEYAIALRAGKDLVQTKKSLVRPAE